MAGCLWFAETGHNLCDRAPGAGFLSYSLYNPAIDTYGRSLALFGMPVSEPAIETNASGDSPGTLVLLPFQRHVAAEMLIQLENVPQAVL